MSLPYDFQSKIEYNSFLHKVFLKELINIMGTIITDLDVESEMKIIRIKQQLKQIFYIND